MKLSYSLTGLLILCAACQPKPQQGYTLNGVLTGDAESGKAYIEKTDYAAAKTIILDSAVISNGKFQLKGKVEQPEMYKLIIDLNKPGEEEDLRNKKLSYPFYLENSDITFEGDVATLPGYFWSERKTVPPTITGSATQDLYTSYQNDLKEINDTLRKLNNRYIYEYNIPTMNGEDKAEVGIEIVKAEKEWGKQMQSKKLEFIKNHPSSVVAYDEVNSFLEGLEVSITAAQIDEMVGWLKPAWEGTPKFESLLLAATKAKKLAIGEPYLDESFLTTKGDTVKLSSIMKKGDYVMLEFWASWCGPCRGEIPHLVKVHQKYPNFELISISVDEKEADWQKAMKEEGMTWKQLRIAGGIYGEAAKAYNITGVPTCIILDKEGRFYKTNMRGAYLDEFLQEIYGK